MLDHTAPPHAVAGQIVGLTIIERGATSDQEVTSGPSGAFEFVGLPVGGIRVFVLSTQYGGVRYASDRIVLTPEDPARAVDLTVYDASPSRSALRAAAAIAIVDVAGGAVRVSVVQGFQNPTDRAVIFSREQPIAFPLPPGAQQVRPLMGWHDPRVVAGRIVDALPIAPGGTHVAYAYELPTRGSEVTVPWSLPYGASELQVLVPETGVTVAADGLTRREPVVGPRARYVRWNGAPVRPGGEVVMRFRGLPVARDPWPGALAAAFGVALFGGLALALRRSTHGPA